MAVDGGESPIGAHWLGLFQLRSMASGASGLAARSRTGGANVSNTASADSPRVLSAPIAVSTSSYRVAGSKTWIV